jgi:transcriptional regulator with XRE-family HTH domain
VARIFRAVRYRLRLRQADVASRARVSKATVWRIEHGRLEEVSLPVLLRVSAALEIRLEVIARWRGGELDRLLSSAHAAFAESVVALLAADGWLARPEVSFSSYGERGVVDLLAWHAATRTLLVIELKTEIVDVGELLGTFDRKRRLAPRIAADFEWRPAITGAAVLVVDTRTNRRRVAGHEQTFRAALADDTRAFRRWLAHPAGTLAALAFLTDPRHASLRQAPASPKRIRRPAVRP